MRRFFSHYTFIYPDIYLQNHIVEIDTEGKITYFFPFEKEIEKTEFYSGWLFFIPSGRCITGELKKYKKSIYHLSNISYSQINDISYIVYDEEERVLCNI